MQKASFRQGAHSGQTAAPAAECGAWSLGRCDLHPARAGFADSSAPTTRCPWMPRSTRLAAEAGTEAVLEHVRQSGYAPTGFEPHMGHLLGEAPIGLVVMAVAQAALRRGMSVLPRSGTILLNSRANTSKRARRTAAAMALGHRAGRRQAECYRGNFRVV